MTDKDIAITVGHVILCVWRVRKLEILSAPLESRDRIRARPSS